MCIPKNVSVLVDGKWYSTITATLLASDYYWDGHSFERQGRNTFLYRTPENLYFTVTISRYLGENEALEPLPETEALHLFKKLVKKQICSEEPFADPALEEPLPTL